MLEVAQAASFQSNEGPLAKVNNTAKFAGYFSSDVEIIVDVPGRSRQTFSGRDELFQAANAARVAIGALSVEFLDITVTLGEDRTSAVVELTGRAKIPADKDFIVQELKFLLKKIGGDWLIQRVETVKTLSRNQAGESIFRATTSSVRNV
jgi:hypothetical protein